MVFSSRLALLLAVILIAVLAVFCYDAARGGLWANTAIGLLGCTALLVFLAVRTAAWPRLSAPEPLQPATTDAGDLNLLLDQVPIALVRYTEGDDLPRAVNKAARTLFQTDDLIEIGGEDLLGALTEVSAGLRPTVSVFGRQYAISVREIVTEDTRTRLASLTDVQVEMHKTEAAALKDTLQVLSHEIMNSLTPVASLADVANAYLENDKPADIAAAREALDMLSRRATNLTRFIEAYRSVARLPEPVLQSVDIGRLVADIAGLFQQGHAQTQIRFEVRQDENLPRLNLDEAQVSQAVINIITNAVEATEGRSEPGRIIIEVQRLHHSVAIRISDNGEGVAEVIRPNLFTAFATTKPAGTGTGLNLARQIALAHGGNLQLLDDPHLTTFALTFPAPPQ